MEFQCYAKSWQGRLWKTKVSQCQKNDSIEERVSDEDFVTQNSLPRLAVLKAVYSLCPVALGEVAALNTLTQGKHERDGSEQLGA